jgi:hypothetical protein
MGIPAALLASAILALDPWHISLTRTAHEVGFAPLFLIAALWAWDCAGILPNPPGFVAFSAPTQRPGILAVIGGILMGALAWVYPATRLFTPIFLIVLAFLGIRNLARFGRSKTGKQALIGALSGLAIGTAPIWVTAFTHPEQLAARARATLIFTQPWPVLSMMREFALNLARNIDPGYSFWRCEDMSGMRMPVGQHLLVIAPLFAIGLTRVLANCRRSAWSQLILIWIALGLLPAAICRDWNPHPFRTIALLPVFPIVAAYGGLWLLAVLSKQSHSLRASAVAVATFVFLFSIAHFARGYLGSYPKGAEPGYQTALMKAIDVACRHADQADFVLVTNRSNQPYIYVLLLAPISPRDLPKLPRLIADDRFGFSQFLRIGKYYFAPGDPERSPHATAQFREVFKDKNARGLVVERAGRFRGGDLLAHVPCGAGLPEEDFEVRWWRVGDSGDPSYRVRPVEN